MAKKNFSSGFDKLLGNTPEQKNKEEKNINEKEAPKKSKTKESIIEHQEEVDPEVRATYIIKQSTVNKLKDIAYWERAMLKEIIQEALEEYVEAWEKENEEFRAKKKRKSKRR
ncbi:hypothetical protein [Aureispira sp. CCB-QB1]|uniref:hypothetical protein n=1 Tax=Aureispira sp. CCB-QB1 TaxID=1313421 RepID=UPI000697446A|nr:hypothetical protein [Aureispira sp. CCB-QB1]